MVYNDDEPIPANAALSVDNSDFNIAGKTRATIFNNTEAPLAETDFKVMIELLGAGSGKDRSGVDLVAVLDVSGSMGPEYNSAREDRIAKLKVAMQFLIKKLSPIDRLSIVEFNHEARRLCPLRQVTDKSQAEIEKIVNGLVSKGGTDILAGLKLGLQVLNDRRLTTGRVSAIMLMSDGEQKYVELPAINVPVHTFGVGQNYDPKLLEAIASNSKGGTFSDVQKDNLSIAFSQCLAGLLTVVVQDLTLTVKKNASEISKVSAGNYPLSGSVTISFGDLYDKELRRILVDLRLPAAVPLDGTNEMGADVLDIIYTYSAAGGKPFKSATRTVNITRIGTEAVPETPEVMNELLRLSAVDKVKEARVMADKSEMQNATNKIVEAQGDLEDADEPNELIKSLLSELNQLVKLMQTKDIYDKLGRAFLLSLVTSHERQRAAAKGAEVKPGGAFATPRMNSNIEQAKKYTEDPNTPVPTADEDVKEEILADPLASIAGALSYHIQTAIQSLSGIQTAIESLKAIDNIINNRGR